MYRQSISYEEQVRGNLNTVVAALALVGSMEESEAVSFLRLATKRMVPKKMVEVIDEDTALCPTCYEYLEDDAFIAINAGEQVFCPRCGQLIADTDVYEQAVAQDGMAERVWKEDI